ncbi:MAG TPA: Hsp20/alpha crystallin family protein [Nitrososphaeraceae archaeon]|nr:Hsp20/alpha crystallin family protein [Nitrososphaeraceae archaeon]
MEDDDGAERITRFLKANGYHIAKSDITQILNQMAQTLERQIEKSNNFEERPLLCEVIRFSKEIKIIAELPGAFEDNININAYDNEIEIEAQSERRSYYEIINLPPDADTKVLKFTFLNGFLELTLKKKSIRNKAKAHKG